MLRLIRNHPLVAFFTLAFAFSWAILVPDVLGSRGLIDFRATVPLLLLMGYGPTLTAIVASGIVGGRAEIRRLLGHLLIWRVGWRWWAVTLFLSGGSILGALGLYALSGADVPPFPALEPSLLLTVPLTFIVVALFNGEEVGWRGFALPRLQQRYGVPVTVGVLGVIESLSICPSTSTMGPRRLAARMGHHFSPSWPAPW